MSLSQKHCGKVLVPWFNIAEWQNVYELIYSQTNQDWRKALKILQIWKHRTPLLSAGVEGTLIVLEALLINTNQLSSYEISHIFSTSLVRFLNLCAANSEKQGTFYKTAMKNELPKWLINIRHDIAHSHKVPSESMLLISLKFCLEWLKDKYWDKQCENMVDFIIIREHDIVEDCIYIFEHFDDEKLFQKSCIARLMNNNHKQLNKGEIWECTLAKLKETILKHKEESCGKLSTLLIENLIILSINYDVETKRLKKLPLEVINKWGPLINLLYETEILQNFVQNLFNFICEVKHELKYREIASLWIREIYISLINKKNNCQDESNFSFTNNNHMKTKIFAVEVLKNLCPFTLNFVREILEYNEAPSQFVEDSVNLITIFNTSSCPKSSKIFTLEDLNFNLENHGLHELQIKTTTKDNNSRWKLIEDTSIYMNLPLGVLPHQSRHVNPLLEV